MKILVLGYGRHGKDTVCEILRDEFGYSFVSSSMFCAERVVYPLLQNFYNTFDECYEDRHNNRALWFNLIKNYNAEDKSKLSKEILAEYDIYCGMRNVEEFKASRCFFDLVVWVDASKRLPIEDKSSITVKSDHADFVIDNNGTLDQLKRQVKRFASLELN